VLQCVNFQESNTCEQGCRQRNFQGGREGQRKKDRKIAKRPKIAQLSLFQGGANEKKDRKIAKKD